MDELFDKWWKRYPWPKEYDYTVASHHVAKAAFAAGYSAGHVAGQDFAADAMIKIREIVVRNNGLSTAAGDIRIINQG